MSSCNSDDPLLATRIKTRNKTAGMQAVTNVVHPMPVYTSRDPVRKSWKGRCQIAHDSQSSQMNNVDGRVPPTSESEGGAQSHQYPLSCEPKEQDKSRRGSSSFNLAKSNWSYRMYSTTPSLHPVPPKSCCVS